MADQASIQAVLDRIRVIVHSAVRIESSKGTVLYVDPFHLPSESHDATAVLFTHTHYDHFSPEDASKVSAPDTIFVAPASAAGEVGGFAKDALQTLQAGESLNIGDVAVTAVPAYNVEPERLNFHPQANGWVGYVFTVDGVRVYVSGDTDQNPHNETVSCDIAVIPIGGTYTCDPVQAAAFANKLSPAVVVPTHYGDAVGTPEDVDAFTPLVSENILVSVKEENLR